MYHDETFLSVKGEIGKRTIARLTKEKTLGEQLGTITIDKRFCGPPESGNGGYVCGQLASFVDSQAEVTLRLPPPLQKPLTVFRGEGGGAVLMDGERLVAEAKPAPVLALDVPEAPSFAEAQEASKTYAGFAHHAFPTCFVCGPQREEGDGLRLFPGWLPDRSMVAAPFVPDRSLAVERRFVSPSFMWAALDCPGAFAVGLGDGRFLVLGRLAAEIYQPLWVEESCVSIGWSLGTEGRKCHAGTAVFNESGALVAKAKATWLEIDPAAFGALTKG